MSDATKMDVRPVSYDDCIPFIMGVHYARRIPCIQYAFGLFDGEELIGVVTYGQPASPSLCKGVAGDGNRSRVLELNRLAMKPGRNGGNNASHLVGRSLRMLPKGMIVVSYADAEGWGHVGHDYQATNWMYTGMTKSRTDKYSEGHSRHYAKDETRRQYRTSKHRYLFITGGKRERRELLKQIRYPILDHYPKGDGREYDTSDPKPLVATK